MYFKKSNPNYKDNCSFKKRIILLSGMEFLGVVAYVLEKHLELHIGNNTARKRAVNESLILMKDSIPEWTGLDYKSQTLGTFCYYLRNEVVSRGWFSLWDVVDSFRILEEKVSNVSVSRRSEILGLFSEVIEEEMGFPVLAFVDFLVERHGE